MDHKKLSHSGVIKCPHCDKTFTWAQHRDAHVKNKHDTETANRCACSKAYVKKWQLERHEQDCVVSPIGGANAVKRKYAELVLGLQDNTREEDAVSGLEPESEAALSTIKEEAFNIVREEAQKKLQGGDFGCETCGAPYGNRESLKRHIRKKHPRSGEAIIASGISESGNETPEINAQ